MKLRQEISRSLYQAIREKYESGLYGDAILAAIFHLEECIRSKTHLERTQFTAEPLHCIGHVFGSPNPLIRINSMTTAAQIYEQNGFEQLLLGLYKGIRDPRIHSGLQDDEQTANVMIVFIDYLVQRVGNGVSATSDISSDISSRQHWVNSADQN